MPVSVVVTSAFNDYYQPGDTIACAFSALGGTAPYTFRHGMTDPDVIDFGPGEVNNASSFNALVIAPGTTGGIITEVEDSLGAHGYLVSSIPIRYARTEVQVADYAASLVADAGGLILVDATAADVNVTLWTANGNRLYSVDVVRVDASANDVNLIVPDVLETINGGAGPFVITAADQWKGFRVKNDNQSKHFVYGA